MKIAMMGTRGIPASYSGFETLIEELGSRLAFRGHEITVYGRTHHIAYREPVYRGMRIVLLPTVRNKYTDTIVHTFLSTVHGLGRRYDIVLICIAGNSPVAWIPRLARQKVVLHVDGQDWRRAKWPLAAKRFLQFAEYVAPRTANRVLTDADDVQAFYRERFHRDISLIGYGASATRREPGPWLEKFGLEPRRYILFVGRLVPENCAHHLTTAFAGLDTEMKCVIVGDAPYANDYIRELKAVSDPRVVFTGYVFGEGYQELSSNAYAFVETSGARGTHPAVIEALGYGNCVIVNSTPESLAAVGDSALSYDGARGADALRPVLRQVLEDPALAALYRDRAARRAEERFSWDAVADQYERLFRGLVESGSRRPEC